MREKKKKKTYIVDVENLAYKNSFISLDISIFLFLKPSKKCKKFIINKARIENSQSENCRKFITKE